MWPTPTYLKGYEEVVAVYGYWPSFHDSPLIDFVDQGDSIEFEVEAWELTSEADERGFLKSIKHHYVRFRFDGVTSRELNQCAPSNTFLDICFSDRQDWEKTGAFKVELNSVMDAEFCGQFMARSGGIMKLSPANVAAAA